MITYCAGSVLAKKNAAKRKAFTENVRDKKIFTGVQVCRLNVESIFLSAPESVSFSNLLSITNGYKRPLHGAGVYLPGATDIFIFFPHLFPLRNPSR